MITELIVIIFDATFMQSHILASFMHSNELSSTLVSREGLFSQSIPALEGFEFTGYTA